MLILISAAIAACEPTDVHSAVRKAMDSYSDRDETTALANLIEVRANLACATDIVYAPELANLYWLGGASAARVGQAEVAAEWYRTSALLPTRPAWNEFILRAPPPDYTAALQFENDATITARSAVWIDGYALAQGQQMNARSGTHLVQWYTSDGLVHGEVVTLATGPAELGPEPAAVATTSTSAKKTGPSAARVVVGGVGAAAVVGAGFLFWEALNLSRDSDDQDETFYYAGVAVLGVGVGTTLVSTVLLADGTPGIGVSGQF